MVASDCFVSVVAPLYNDAAVVGDFITDVMTVLEKNYANFELVLVDDGSRDGTVAKVRPFLGRYKCIRLIRLSRRFGTEVAITSGLDSVIGDFVVVMLPASDPPQLIPELVQRCRNNNGIVFGVRQSRSGEPFWMRGAASLFYWACKRIFKLDLPKNVTHFQVLTRPAVNALTQIKDKYRYLHLLSSYVGYENQAFLYEPISRYGKPRGRSFREAVNLALGILVTQSKHPLRLVTWLGVLASTLNLLYIVYIVLIYFFKDHVAEGWTTLSLQTAGMFFFVFLILMVLSEYVGRILDETKDRPLYCVLEELHSSVLIAEHERRNVVTESLPPEANPAGAHDGIETGVARREHLGSPAAPDHGLSAEGDAVLRLHTDHQ